MFKLQLTFVTLALITSVLSSPIPAPRQQTAASGDLNALAIPGLNAVTGVLGTLGIGGGDDSDNDSSDLLGGLLKRQQDLDDDASDIYQYLESINAVRQNNDNDLADVQNDDTDDNTDASNADVSFKRDFVGRAKRQDGGDNSSDDTGDDTGSDDTVDDSSDANSRREEELAIPFLGGGGRPRRYRGGLRGPPEHTGLAGLGDNLGDALTSLGKGLGQLLKRQDGDGGDDSDSGDDSGDDNSDDTGDDSGDDTTDNSRREDALAIPFLGGGGRPRRGGLRGPPEHTGLAGLGDNLGDALTSLGAGLGQLLKRQSDLDANDLAQLRTLLAELLGRQDSGDDSGDDNGDDSGDDNGDDNSDDSSDDNERREEAASPPKRTVKRPVKRPASVLPIPGLEGLIGPPEHTGLAGLGDNLGDALTSLGAGLGQLL